MGQAGCDYCQTAKHHGAIKFEINFRCSFKSTFRQYFTVACYNAGMMQHNVE
jgi:hypothetical protein